MPVLFNKSTGAAENLADEAAHAALAAGSHEVPLVGADGQMGSAALQDAQHAVQSGYRQPTPEELQGALDKTKYEAPAEVAKTAVEGAVNGATFGLGNDLEAAVLGNSKEQLKRREVNPGTHMLGQGAGLVGTSLLGFGEGAALEALGSAVAPKAVTTLGRVGSAATKSAIENMVFQGSDDASKAFMGDPNVTASHFVADVGMAGVLGLALGGAGKGTAELWALGPGKKLGTLLDGIKGRTEPSVAERLAAVANQVDNSVNNGVNNLGNRIGEATNTLSDNMGTVAQTSLDAGSANSAANINAINGVGSAVTDAANLGADNAGAIGSATIEAINAQGNATRAALEGLAKQRSDVSQLLAQVKEGGPAGDVANAELLKALARAGVEGPNPALEAMAGVEIPESMRAALGSNADTRSKWAVLTAGQSKAANAAKTDLNQFVENLSNGARDAVGMTADDIKQLPNVSEASVGKAAAKDVREGVQAMVDTVGPEFEEFHAKAADVPLAPDNIATISNRVFEAAEAEGWMKSPSSAEHALIKRVLSELPLQENAKDLAKYTTLINAETERAEMWHIGSVLRKVFREETDNVIAEHLAASGGAELVAKFAEARKSYGALMDVLEQYNQRLKLGNFNGPKDFISRLTDLGKKPEALLKRLNFGADENLATLLERDIPNAYKSVADYHRAELVRTSLNPDRASINVKKLGKNIDELAPEFRKRILPEGAADRVRAIESLERNIPEQVNKSGTAGTLMAMLGNLSPSGVGMATTMATGPVGGAAAFVIKKMADYVGKEAPDAITLATLKSLGSNMPTSPSAFKQMAAVAGAVIRGETKLNKAVKAVLSGGTKVISEPSQSDIKKLKEHVDTASMQPEKLLEVGGDMGHYMPEAGSAVAETTLRVVQYLASIKPSKELLGPLDGERTPSKAEEYAYDRALRIAESPMVLLNDIRAGHITPAEIQHLKAMYPDLHARMSAKLMHEVINTKGANKTVPYATKIALTSFMGQPLEASLRQPNIAASQMSFGGAPTPTMQGMPTLASGSKPPRSNPHMIKVADSYATPTQMRAQSRHGRP